MPNSTMRLFLESVIRLIEQGWCQGAYAQNPSGIRCFASDADATRFCLQGAIQRVAFETYQRELRPLAIKHVMEYVGNILVAHHPQYRSTLVENIVTQFNDNSTKETVLDELRSMIKP